MSGVEVEQPVKPARDPSAREREERLAERYCSLRAAGYSLVEALALATRNAPETATGKPR